VKIWKIDVLVNNTGGIGVRARFEEMTTKEYKFVMALNLDSVFYASRAAYSFQKGENASIINYTSNAAWNGAGPGAGIYAVSKGGVQSITRALAKI
jgi:NAD(P)-dependent dehydrogenase (short-subunit alcohol dehydrogenase family)